MYNRRMTGTLFIVSTPIGNMNDITLRAIETLKSVDLVVCEDSRLSGGLLHHLEIKKEMMVVNDVNEENKIYDVIEKLQNGLNLALISDAGTPLISDPGFKLVRECVKRNITVVPIPGVSSIIAALSASALPTDKFLFLGYSPDTDEKKKKWFLNIKSIVETSNNAKMNPTIVFFESPHKFIRTLDAILETLGDIELVVAREMTKIYEEFLRLTASDLKKHFEEHPPKGEFVILFKL